MDLSTYNTRPGKKFDRHPVLQEKLIPAGGLPIILGECRPIKNNQRFDLVLEFYVPAFSDTNVLFLKADGVLLQQLIERFGNESETWKGKDALFVLAKGRFINLGDSGATAKAATAHAETSRARKATGTRG